MASQFVRLNTYGPAAKASARRRRHENAFDILDEAGRVPGATPHIGRSSPPEILYGHRPHDLKSRLNELIAIALDERGAPLRHGAPILYAIVASYPAPWRELREGPADAVLRDWCRSVVAWLEQQFGSTLQSVVMHLDEERPHIHAFALPLLGPLNRIDHSLHPGRLARKEARRAGADRIAGERAYRAGMRAFQQGYFETVSQHFGHDRTGPRRRRFQRDVALQRQTVGRFLENMSIIAGGVMARVGQSGSDELQALLAMIALARLQHDRGRTDALAALASALDKGERFVTGAFTLDTAQDQHFIGRPSTAVNYPEAGNDDPDSMPADDLEDEWEDDPGPDGFDSEADSADAGEEDFNDHVADGVWLDEFREDDGG